MQQAPATVIEVGTLHPVSGPAIEPGVLVLRGREIVAAGPAGSVEVPDGATHISYPDAHAYPGFVDAMTSAYADPKVLGAKDVNAGVEIAGGLDPYLEHGKKLLAAGITTAYVGSRAETTWRGIGAVVRPAPNGFSILDDTKVGVHMRATLGPKPSHPLVRAKALDGLAKAFDGLDKYEKGFEKHEEALKKYEKDFAAWLEHHRKSEGKSEAESDDKPDGKPAKTPAPGDGERGPSTRRRGRRGGDRPRPPQQGAQEEKKEENKEKEAAGKKSDKPTRPKYPKKPKRDPAKDALLAVLAGDHPLWVEVHRTDEIRAVLAMAKDKEIPLMVLEHASLGDRLAEAIARSGSPVVITNLLPGSVPKNYCAPGRDRPPEGSLPGRLAAAGVAVAIASGSVTDARHLSLMAAYAVGRGLDPKTALRAITLTPAEILGIQDKVGSLEPGKLADVVICSGPLFASDSRILRVLSAGQTVYEADQ